jgi:cobalt-zinc-cadmium efflux system membrane fusion protein
MRSELLLTCVLCVVVTACDKKAKAADPAETIKADPKGVTLTDDAPQWKYVELAVAKKQPPLAPLPVPARVDLDEKRTANVGVPLAGRVESVHVRLGTRVKAGDKLFSVRSGAFADLDRETEGARAQVAVRQRVLERVKELYDLKAAAQKDLLTADAELREAELTLKTAESKQRSLQVVADGDNLFWVKSPRGGTVVDLDVYSGQEVSSEREKPLLRLSDLDEVLVIADLPEADVADLGVGQAITIKLQATSTTRPGTIEYISEVVDPRRRTVEVRARALNADRGLRPNAFVEVVAGADGHGPTVRVPDAAIVTQGTHSVVFVATGPGRLEAMPVVVGRRANGESEVHSGLDEGTRYVSQGALLLLNQVQLSGEH